MIIVTIVIKGTQLIKVIIVILVVKVIQKKKIYKKIIKQTKLRRKG